MRNKCMGNHFSTTAGRARSQSKGGGLKEEWTFLLIYIKKRGEFNLVSSISHAIKLYRACSKTDVMTRSLIF